MKRKAIRMLKRFHIRRSYCSNSLPHANLDVIRIADDLRRCAKSKFLKQGKSIHDHILRIGLHDNVLLGNLLMQMYGNCGAFGDARRVFDQLNERNSFSWNIILSLYSRKGQPKEARCIFEQMPEKNAISWNTMLAAYAQQGELTEAINLFRQMPEKSVVSWTALISGFAGKGLMNEAFQLFQAMPNPNVVSWTAMVSGYVSQGKVEQAFQLFEQMPHRNVFSWTTMLKGLAKKGHLKKAVEFFHRMPQRNLVSWNVMIAAYIEHGCLQEALELFNQMPQRDVVSWTTMIVGHSELGDIKDAIFLFHAMPEHDIVSWNAMIGGHICHGQLKEALKLFREMPQKNVASWNCIISGYASHGQLDEVLQLFNEMQMQGMQPNQVTFIGILDACANTIALSRGKWVHNLLGEYGLGLCPTSSHALINMYAKCGSLDAAVVVFDHMSWHNVVSWNSLITAYAQHGYGKEAICALEQMQAEGVMLDEVTLYSILSACSRAGLLEEGCQHFISLTGYQGIQPTLIHYNCLIDLLGRMELLAESEALICNLPFQADDTSWRAFLGSCKTHGNLDRAKRAAELVHELDLGDSSSYVLLASAFATHEKLNDASNDVG